MDLNRVTASQTTTAKSGATQAASTEAATPPGINAFADYLSAASATTTRTDFASKLTSAFIRSLEKGNDERAERPDPLVRESASRPGRSDTRDDRRAERAEEAPRTRDQDREDGDDQEAQAAANEDDDGAPAAAAAPATGEAGSDPAALLAAATAEDGATQDAAPTDPAVVAAEAVDATPADPEALAAAVVAPVAAQAAETPAEDGAAEIAPQQVATDPVATDQPAAALDRTARPQAADRPADGAATGERTVNPATVAAEGKAAQAATRQATTPDPAAARQAEQLARDLGEAGRGQNIKVQVQTASQGQTAQAAAKAGSTQAAASEGTGEVAQFRANPATQTAAAVNPATTAGNGGHASGQQQGAGQQPQAQPQPASQAAAASPAAPAAATAQPAEAPSFQAMARAAAGGQGAGGQGAGGVGSGTATGGAQASATSQAADPAGQGLPQAARAEDVAKAETRAQQAQTPQRHDPATRAQAVEQVKVKIAQSATGQDRMSIQLKPADLGRVDIQLKVSNGQVTAQVMAERPETLEILKADAQGLQKALSDAGLDGNSASLNFSLRGEGQAGQAGDQGGRGPANPYAPVAQTLDDDLSPTLDLAAHRSSLAAARGGVDISI